MPGIWDTVKGQAKKKRFPSWPKPFNAVERIDVLNCNEVMQMRVQFVFEIVGEFIWDARVPSPTELFRNWVFGQLHCGSKMGVKPHTPGPGSLFLKKQGRVMLAEIGGMIGYPLMVWSMVQSYFNALNTWNSIKQVQAFCEEPEAHGIMRDGESLIKHVGLGGVTGYVGVYDPFNVGNYLTGFWLPISHPMQAWAFGEIFNNNGLVTAVLDIWVELFEGNPPVKQHLEIAPLGHAVFSVYNSSPTAEVAEVRHENFVEIPGVVNFLEVRCERFCVQWGFLDPFPEGGLFEPWPSPNPTCFAMYADGMPIP